MFVYTMSLMIGTAGLPHVIIRFFTVPKVKDARTSAGWALVFIAILYTTAPAVGAMARLNLMETIQSGEVGAADGNMVYADRPSWFKNWEITGLLKFEDKNDDGRVQYYNDKNEEFAAKAAGFGWKGNEMVKVDRDIMVLANPQIANLPNWVIGLIAAGGLAAALSTAAGLLLVISTAVSHDLMKRVIKPDITEKNELWVARAAAGVGVICAGYFGIFPPGFVAEVVALAFGLAASSFFPCIMLGIFSKRANREGIVVGMITGIVFTGIYIAMFKFSWANGLLSAITSWEPGVDKSDYWLFGISPEGIGSVGMVINFVVAIVISMFTKAPPQEIQDLIEDIRVPKGAGEAHEMNVPPPVQGE